MTDLIIYCKDTKALIAELQSIAPDFVSIEDNGNGVFLVDKTKTIRRGDETLALVRADERFIKLAERMKSITVLGTYDDVFSSPDKSAIYDRVYDQSPTVYKDSGGIDRRLIIARKFGVFTG